MAIDPGPVVDWSPFKPPESTVTCHCDGVWRSHAKAVMHNGRFVLVAQKPCPSCGEYTHVRSARGDPERMELK